MLLLACSWATIWAYMPQGTSTPATTGVWGIMCCWHMQLLCNTSGASCLTDVSA